MDLFSSHDANRRQSRDMAVMRETGFIVISTVDGTLYQFSLQEGRLIEKRVKPPCRHGFLYLLCVQVVEHEYLALSCRMCGYIKLMNLNKQTGNSSESQLIQYELITAFSGVFVNGMCHGEKNRLFVRSSSVVLEMDTSSTTFKKVKTIGIDSPNYSLDMCSDMCFVPDPHRLLVVSGSDGACARFCDDNKIAWRVHDSTMYDSLRNILYAPTLKAILVGDQSKRSLTFLNPGNGAKIQSIRLFDYDIYMHEIPCISLFNDRIIVASKGNRGRISYLISFK